MPMSTITVAGINPGLNVLGNTQQLNYTQQLSVFQLTNSFVPIISLPSQFNQEFRNNVLSGFRWTHLTTSTDTYGSLTLQSFLNASTTGTDIIGFDVNGVGIHSILNLNSHKITNLLNPTLAQDGATKNYVDTEIASAIGIPVGIVAALYISTPAATTLATTGFTKIAGTTTTMFLNTFDTGASPTSNYLRYIGTGTINTLVSVNLTAIPVLANSTIGIAIYQNNSSPSHIGNYNFQLTAGKATNLSVSMYINFATNDYIEVFINNDLPTDVTVSDMTLTVVI